MDAMQLAGPPGGLNFLDVVQTLGIVAGFALTIWQLRAAAKLTRFDIFWRIGDSNRNVWRPVLEDPALGRILSEAPDLEGSPVTEPEHRLLVDVILHIENVYRATKEGYYKLGTREGKDIGELFNLPIPAAVWSEVRRYQPTDFVNFIETLRKQHRGRPYRLATQPKE